MKKKLAVFLLTLALLCALATTAIIGAAASNDEPSGETEEFAHVVGVYESNNAVAENVNAGYRFLEITLDIDVWPWDRNDPKQWALSATTFLHGTKAGGADCTWFSENVLLNGKSIADAEKDGTNYGAFGPALMLGRTSASQPAPNAPTLNMHSTFNMSDKVLYYVWFSEKFFTGEIGTTLTIKKELLDTCKNNGIVSRRLDKDYTFKFDGQAWLSAKDEENIANLEWADVALTSVSAPKPNVTGNIKQWQFRLTFDKAISDAYYPSINSYYAYPAGLAFGVTPGVDSAYKLLFGNWNDSAFTSLASYGVYGSFVSKLYVNGHSMYEYMLAEKSWVKKLQSINVMLGEYGGNLNFIDIFISDPQSQNGDYQMTVGEKDFTEDFTVEVKSGFKTPLGQQVKEDQVFRYSPAAQRFVRQGQSAEASSDCSIERIIFNGAILQDGDTVEMLDSVSFSKDLITVVTKDAFATYEVYADEFVLGDNEVAITVYAQDGTQADYAVNVKLIEPAAAVADNGKGGGCGSSTAARGGAAAAVLLVAAAVTLAAKRRCAA